MPDCPAAGRIRQSAHRSLAREAAEQIMESTP